MHTHLHTHIQIRPTLHSMSGHLLAPCPLTTQLWHRVTWPQGSSLISAPFSHNWQVRISIQFSNGRLSSNWIKLIMWPVISSQWAIVSHIKQVHVPCTEGGFFNEITSGSILFIYIFLTLVVDSPLPDFKPPPIWTESKPCVSLSIPTEAWIVVLIVGLCASLESEDRGAVWTLWRVLID